MINTSKLAIVAAVALASIAPPAFAHTHHRHHARHFYSADAGYRANASVKPAVDSDDPALTGGGSMGFNKCGGHPSC
jgi:hypothetical protein